MSKEETTIYSRQFYEMQTKFLRFTPEENSAEVHRVNTVMPLLHKIGYQSILDVGCGDGYLCHLLRQEGKDAVGVDISAKRMEFARSRYAGCDFGVADIRSLPFGDDSFDVVAAVEVLEHLSDPVAAVGELKRVSKRHIVFSVPYKDAPVELVCPRCLTVFEASGHLHNWIDERWIEQFCQEAGLAIVEIHKYSSLYAPHHHLKWIPQTLLSQIKKRILLAFDIVHCKYVGRAEWIGVLCRK